MRNGLLLGGMAAVLAVAALVISVIALISPPGAPDEYGDDYEFRQSDRGKSTVDLVQQALRRYDEKGREATSTTTTPRRAWRESGTSSS